MNHRSELHVAVGVIKNQAGEILIARRHDHLHQGGLWEFPGGKVESGETAGGALRRELREELAITLEEASPLLKVRHDYPERRVLLDVWQVHAFSGTPSGVERQPIRWVSAEELSHYDFPAANRPIVAAARLPECYAILDDENGDSGVLFHKLQQWVEKGLRLIRLRAKKLDAVRYREFAERACGHCRSRGIALLLNAEPDLVVRTGAAGVHLTSARLMALNQRPLSAEFWVAASCHNLEELRQAERVGVDFVVLSPVLDTPSHPEATALGWPHFGALVNEVNLRVFALGGMRPAHLLDAKRHGAQGIAGIRGL